jgi:hypothetical protein
VANALLVSYAGYPLTPSSLCPDNGLALLASCLREAGHQARVLDYGTLSVMRRLYPETYARRAAPLLMEMATPGGVTPALLEALGELEAELEAHRWRELEGLAEELAAQVLELQPALVGFKLWNGDGYSGSVYLAESLKRRFPGLFISAGGPHATWCGSAILARTGAFDALVLGEGEDKIVALMDAARGVRSVEGLAGIITPANPAGKPTFTVDLADLPGGDYSLATYPAMAGDEKLKLVVVDDSRGCPYGCAFCTHPVESGRRLRTRPAAQIVGDMARVAAEQGIGAFRFAGSSTPGSLMAEVAEGLLARDLPVRYTSFAHFASSAPDHFGRMRASGLEAMFFGLETGSSELLRRAAGKPITVQAIRATVQEAKAAGIAVVCSMIVPMPFETEETLAESLRLLLDIRPDSVPLQFPGLFPGTPWFERPREYGFDVDIPQYVRENMDYKFRLLFPPQFWQPLPYRVNGMDFAQFTAVTGRFAAALEAEGILTGVPDDNLLMASVAGLAPRQFRDLARLWCASGDAGAMDRFISTFNRNSAIPAAAKA